MSLPAIANTSDTSAFWSDQAGRLMRTNPRQTWLVPLLAVPLSHIALSRCCIPDVLASSALGYDVTGMRREAASIAALAASTCCPAYRRIHYSDR